MIDESYANILMCVGRTGSAGIDLMGTAFGIGGRKFATAAHLTGQSDKGLVLCLPRALSVHDYQDAGDTNVRTTGCKIVGFDPVSDIAILEAEGIYLNSNAELVGTDSAPVGTALSSLGFPHCGDARMILTYQSTTVGARVLLPTGPVRRKHLVLNILTRPGQSGSPIFIDGTNKICGMLLGSYVPQGAGQISIGGIDPFSLHQTTHAISAEYIREML